MYQGYPPQQQGAPMPPMGGYPHQQQQQQTSPYPQQQHQYDPAMQQQQQQQQGYYPGPAGMPPQQPPLGVAAAAPTYPPQHQPPQQQGLGPQHIPGNQKPMFDPFDDFFTPSSPGGNSNSTGGAANNSGGSANAAAPMQQQQVPPPSVPPPVATNPVPQQGYPPAAVDPSLAQQQQQQQQGYPPQQPYNAALPQQQPPQQGPYAPPPPQQVPPPTTAAPTGYPQYAQQHPTPQQQGPTSPMSQHQRQQPTPVGYPTITGAPQQQQQYSPLQPPAGAYAPPPTAGHPAAAAMAPQQQQPPTSAAGPYGAIPAHPHQYPQQTTAPPPATGAAPYTSPPMQQQQPAMYGGVGPTSVPPTAGVVGALPVGMMPPPPHGGPYGQQHGMPIPTTGTPPPQQQQQPQAPLYSSTSIDEDRAKLEEIVRLRKELEAEQERERSKRAEMETWPCSTCTFRNRLTVEKCEMCETQKPGTMPKPAGGAVVGAVNNNAAAGPTPTGRPVPQQQPRESDKPQPAIPTGILKPQSKTVQIFPPGKWACSTCALTNVHELNNCRACNTKRRPEDTIAPQGGPANSAAGGAASASSSSSGPSANEYSCPTCTLFNARTVQACSACTTPNPYYQRTAAPPPQGRVVQAQPAPTASGPFNCPTCTFANAAAVARCGMCGTPNPNAPQRVSPSPQQHGGGGGYPGNTNTSGRVMRTSSGQTGNTTGVTSANESDEDAVQWQKDDVVTNCNKCNAIFSTFKRRHHCRACGFVFCDECSKYRIKVKDKGVEERVCLDCYRERLK